MPINSKVKRLYDALKADGGDVGTPEEFNSWFFKPGKEGYKNRKSVYDTFKADGADVGKNYEEFGKWLGLHAVYPTVNKYHQQMLNSVDPNKSRASELTHRAVSQAKRGMNNVRKPVVAKVVNREGKPTGKEFAITPAKTVEDLDREYAQETTKNWENELHDQMADADKDAAKISDMFKSFIGSTDEVGSVWGNMARGGGIAGTPHSVTTNNGILENTKARQLLAARDYNRKRKELLQLEQDSRNGAIFDNHSFFRGMYDAAKDTGILTGGASNIINAGSLLATRQDLDNGVHTEAGDMLMQQAVKNSNAQSQYGDNKGWMYTGGVITTNMAPFIVQIASAGFLKGLSTSIGKVVQGAASKVALGTMKKAAGFASADLAKNIGKVTGLTTKAFGKAIQYGIVGAAQANTVGLGNVANDVINRYTGQVYQDEQGNYKFGTFDSDGKLVHEGGEDFLTAFVKGDAAQTIEFATELAGGGIDAVGTALKNFVIKGGKKIINKYNMENVSKVIDFLLNNKVSKNVRYLKAGADRTLGKVEVNSIVGESLEEELGIIANTVFTGDNKISDLWDEKQQSQIWGGMLLSIGLMKGAVAPFHAYNAKQYYSYKHKLNKADVNLSQLLGKEKWEELRNQIDATTNEDMPEMVNKINRDVALGKNRQPVREYIQNLLIMRGYDIGNMLAAKKAVEDKGEGVSVKNMEKNQAYQQGRDAYGYDTHEIQLDQEDKQKSLAQLIGISEQQLASMSDEELESFSGRDDNIDRAIYDYQLSSARYEGVVDNARDQIDLEVQRAAQAVDMYTDKSRNTIRNATIKASGGAEDYRVYIISGNIATHDDGSIDVSNSDDMILYYDPTTNTVEHADAMMFAELGSEENADEVRSQAMADAKEKAIKETTGIIDGVVEVGTQFKTIDADGTEHTYEVLADNGDGTAMITIDGNIPTELVKGENVNIPVSFEELQNMKDEADQQRLQAAKAQREQMEKERAEQQMQSQTTQAENPAHEDNIQSAPIKDNIKYSDIIREDGKVQMVNVSDKYGNNLFPDAKDVFYIQGNKMRTKCAYIDANGKLKTQNFPTGLVKIKTRGKVSVDDYKKYRNTILAAESSFIPESSKTEDNSGENRGEIEEEAPTIEGETAGSAEETATSESSEATTTEQTPAITLEDGTIVPMLEDGNPDFSKLSAAQTAELYDTQFDEDADGIVSGYVSDAKKALDKANNMTVKGKTFVEQKAAKAAKEKAIADAQAAYDSAIAIRDAYNERQLAKEENTTEGRKSLIEKAKRKFARLKNSEEWSERPGDLWNETVGKLLHRLYDATGIDVFNDTPNTVYEYVAENVGPYSLNYEGNDNSKGVQQETGLSRSDFAKLGWLAAEGKGMTIDAKVHRLWENRPSNLESAETQEIRNALISLITSGQTAFQARDYILNQRIELAESALEEQLRQEEDAAEAQRVKEEEEKKKAELEKKAEEEKKKTEENEKINDNINAPEQNKFPDKLKDGSETIEVPEDATDENPLGLQLSEDKVPFEIEGGKSGETYNINDDEDRQRLINDNKVDDKDILDIDMPKHVHKAIKELCKKMGLKVQFLYMGARSNGWIENGNMYLALDTEKATQFVFGHEMTHAIKQKNSEAYKELVKVAMAVTTRKKFEEDLAKVYQNYHGISGYNNVDDYVEEVVADNLGKFINDFDLAQKFSLRLNHPVLATILHAIQKIKSLLYGDFYKSVDALERIVEKAYVDTANGQVTNSETGEDVSFSLRQKPEPKKKGVGYKVFVLKDGKLYPPMVANPDGAATPVGVWLDADAAPIAGESKTGRPQVKQGGKGTQGGSGKLAYRPGWHLGVVPYAIQFNRKDAEGNKTLFPKNFVFAEVEYAADVDYQEEARQEGINPSGKFQHSLAGLKHLPTDGYYMYRTNPNPETDPWVITGAMKVNRILTRAEQADLVIKAGREPQQIQEGDIVTDDVVNSINQEIADAPKFSLKVYHGSGADFTEFDFDHMGEGAGSQVFGWGGYVTSSEKIGKSYAKIGQMSAEDRHRHASSEDTPIEAAVGSILGQEIYNERAKTFKQKKAQAIENAENSIASYSDMLKNSNELDEKSKKFLEKSIERYKKELEVLRALTEEQYKEEYIKQGRAKNLYEVDIPDDNGSNYLDWENPLNEEQINAIRDALAKNGVDVSSWENRGFKLDLPFKDVYAAVLPMMMRCEPKEVSKFLSSLGFTGIKYPAGTIQGGAEEGDTNYVIFKPEDMKITQHTKFSLRLKAAIEETETNPSDAQKESGNYKKGHIKFGGYDYTIENPKGSTRSGKDANGKEWKVTMHDTYGYIRGKFGKDGDHLDMFINDKADLDNWDGDVFVVDQVNPDGSFDEHKVMYGYDSMDDAEKAYLANYSKGWQGLGNITGASKTEFDKWLDTSNRKLKPFAEYSKVKFSQAQSVNNEEPKTFEEFLNHPSLKFSIKNEEQRNAAENAYEYAAKLRPNKYAQYAIVDMGMPSKVPEYYEKKVLADNWRRFYNRAVHNELNDVRKKAWGNYKLFDLDRPFADQVNEVKGKVPDEFDAPDAATNKDNIKGLDRQMSSVAETRYSLKDIKPIGVGAFGNIYNQFRGKSKAAIEFLKKLGSGEAAAALHHHTIGDISLVWGDKKAGLDKILRKHPEVVDNLQSIIDSMEVVQESDNRVKLESPTHFAVVSKEYNGEPREQRLLTAYEKRESLENDKSMDTATSSLGGDTALSQSKGSAAKIIKDFENPSVSSENSLSDTKFSLRGSTPYDKQMEEWMEKNHLEKGAVPMEKPTMKEGENIFDYANRIVEWTRNQNLWKTAPKQTGFQDALDKWKVDNGLSPDAYPPVRPHREYYSSEIGYSEDLEEYNKKKELWKSAPKPKDFDLSVDLEDMNKQLRNIRRAVLNQKNYDQRTVKAVSDIVRKMLNIGWGDGLSRGKVGNLLSAAKNATGSNDVKKYLDKAMGILAENYLNRLSTAYDNLINTKGARADQSGVIKMGSLDAKGQAFMSEYKKAINMDDKSLNTYIANIEEDSAKNEDNVEMNDYRLAGIQAAIMYKQQIGGNDADISELKRQIGELKNKKDATKEDKDLLKSLEKKLFENKFDRITMYENLLNNIQRMVKESKGRAKEFREEIAEHKNEILHRANLDLEGVDSTYYDTTTAKKKFVNNDLLRAVFSSTYTFEQFLKFFGKHSANGEGRLYNYFHKLNQDALDEEQLYNEMNRNALDEKTKELFGKEKFMKLVGIDSKGMKEMDIEVTDSSNKKTGKRTIHLKQGQMLYIYLVNKETDGEMKLRAMGITEEDVAAIEENLDPRVKAMGVWLQDEYLPECHRRYQATHTKYFGAPMKEVENYFPLAINNRARNVKEDVNQDSDAMSQLAGTSTGAIVTRRVNVIPLDIENADAFEVAFNHLQEMEEWSAMLPFRQDINTLLSYTHFRNQVQNMSSVAYGSGKTLWDEFKQTAQIAAGTYKPKVNAGMMDSRIAAAMGGIAVAKISGRLWTAIKQSQSATVFLPECDFTRFVKNGVNPYGSWKWAMENIPDFRKRVENMTYGDVKLKQYLDELEKWHDWTKTISKIGMAPNILVDGITCAVGARSVYETEVNRLTKLGYPKDKADEKAYYKAVAAYNKTQQSSGGMYLSPMQVDRTYVSAALSLFKNANYAYGRMQIEACRGLARTYDFWGGKHKTTLIESMTRQIMGEDGLNENTARTIAKATYNRTFRQSIGRLINFATLIPVTWALYKVLPYLLTGDDDDKKKDMIEEAVLKGFVTSLSDNYVIPFVSNILNAGLKVEDGKPTFDPEVFRYQNLYINPATSDLANIYSMVGNQKWYSVVNKLGMLGVQSLIGFNPETVGALYQAFAEADYDNGNTAKEWQIGILKAISAPEESIRELYMDELGLKSGDIKKIPLAELEKRYAERQINRDNLLSQIGMDSETFNGYVDKYQKSFEKKIKDKMDKWDEYDKKKADEFFDTTSDPKLKDMIEKKRAKDANAAADEQIAKEGLSQEKKGKELNEEAYDAVKMSIDVAEDNAISTYNKVLNKRYAALNDEYNEQTDAMKYIFMSKHPNFKAYKDLKSEYTTYGKKIKKLKEKLVSADGYDAKQTILKQIRAEREKFSKLQSKVR